MEEHVLRRQTPREVQRDRARMISYKSALEDLLSGSRLSIEQADEWADHWEIPFDFGPTVSNVTGKHWGVFRDLGLHLTEQRDGVEGVAYYVALPKTYSRWSQWPLWPLVLLAAFPAGTGASCRVVGLRIHRFFTP